ncbi:ABC transporter ATP-binding protein [Amycolatopsis sp. NPDC021455]|uniref:ABC transporter ATP-binding protein n=1 Tax=Amycolatopsis sp. NPDC021455 TaxID=3154901 RepID=UPI0033DAC422
MGAAVRVNGLRKQYGDVVAVDDVSFEVGAGEIVGLLGPNGSGKTTTVECVQGLRRADRGEIDIFGSDPRRDAPRVRRLVGSQLQDSALPDRIKVWEALRLFSVLSPQGPPWERLLDDWGLGPQRNTAFGDLSGGQRQRLFVALALVNEPKVVFLDEMTTGLDPAARRVAWDLVAAVRERGTAVVLVTHFMDEAARLCDRIMVLSAGRVVATGTPAELVAARTHGSIVRFTAGGPDGLDYLRGVPGVARLSRTGDQVEVAGTGPLLVRVAHALAVHHEEPADLRVELPSLEDAYLALTGGAAPAPRRAGKE